MRMLADLVDQLPSESATKTAQRVELGHDELSRLSADAQAGMGPFSHSDYLLTALADRLDHIWHALIRVNGGKVEHPKPLPRPGIDDGAAKPATPEQIAYLTAIRERHRAQQQQAREGGTR